MVAGTPGPAVVGAFGAITVWARAHRIALAFAASCSLVFAVRFGVLAGGGAAPGVDGGNWLAFGRALLGEPVRSQTIVYPPLVPALITGAVSLFGTVNGVALVAAVAALAPALGLFVVLRTAGLGWASVVLAGSLATAASTGEAAAWGGYPQLIGIGLGLVFLSQLHRCLSLGRTLAALAAGVLLALLMATSHFVSLVAVVAAVVLVVLHLSGTWPISRRATAATARQLLLVSIPCLPLVPLYLAMARALSGSGSNSSPLHLTWDNLAADVAHVFRGAAWFWGLALAVMVATPVVLHRRGREGLWAISTSLLCSAILLMAATREPRYLYILPPVAMLSLGLWVVEHQQSPLLPSAYNRWMAGAVGAALVAQAIAGLAMFPSQREFYGILTPGVVAGISWLRAETKPSDLVAVAPVNDAPLGWWVEGLGHRRTLPGSALRWLNFEDERRRALLANEIFLSGFTREFPDEDSVAVASAAGVRYLFVAKAWAGYTEITTEQFRRRHPEAFAFENTSVLILDVSRARAPVRPPACAPSEATAPVGTAPTPCP